MILVEILAGALLFYLFVNTVMYGVWWLVGFWFECREWVRVKCFDLFGRQG